MRRPTLTERLQLDRLGYGRDVPVGVRSLTAVAYSSVGAGIYVTLGVVTGSALGLTPLVMLGAGVMFAISAMTYAEGAALHPERGAGAAYSRYAFNELVSFVAGWAILLDYLILIALGALALPYYLIGGLTDSEVDRGVAMGVAVAVVAMTAFFNVRGFSRSPRRRWAQITLVDIVVLLIVVIAGLAVSFDPGAITRHIHLGVAPTWENVVFAATVVAVCHLGVEHAANLAPDIDVTPRSIRRVIVSGSVLVTILFVGMGLVATMAVPVFMTPAGGGTELATRYLHAPVLGIVVHLGVPWLSDVLRVVVALVGAAMLLLAANSGMMGVTRLGYSLARNRQIPGSLARLHPTRSTPYILVGLSALLAIVLLAIGDVYFLTGVFAFGAMLTFSLANFAVVVLRYREPDSPRPYRVPWSVKLGRGSVPLPALIGGLVSLAALVAVIAYRDNARWVGIGWLVAGILLYVGYRRLTGMPIGGRVEVAESALREAPTIEFANILVPVFGTELDDDIVGTAGRLAAEATKEGPGEGALIVAMYVVEVPTVLPLDAPLVKRRIAAANRALERAKEVGEEYDGVAVSPVMVRARSAGAAIVDQARRANVEAIVLGAEPPSRIGGGPGLGGLARTRPAVVGPVTQYVVHRAPCRVILTAPPAEGEPATSDLGTAENGA